MPPWRHLTNNGDFCSARHGRRRGTGLSIMGLASNTTINSIGHLHRSKMRDIINRGVARGGQGGQVPPSAKRTDFFQKTHKVMVMVTGEAARCWKNAFHAFGSAIFFFGGGRTQTPRMDFTTSVLAGSGSARHGTVCPPKPKILATPLINTYKYPLS